MLRLVRLNRLIPTGVIEVKRFIVKDNASQVISSGPTGSMFKDDLDARATPLDDLMLDSYRLGPGTLRKRRLGNI